MSLNGPALGDAVVSAIQGVQASPPSPDDGGAAFLKAYWEAVGTAIVNYITTNAVVLPNTMNNPAGQPVATSGTSTNQTGATTSPETIQGTGKIS